MAMSDSFEFIVIKRLFVTVGASFVLEGTIGSAINLLLCILELAFAV